MKKWVALIIVALCSVASVYAIDALKVTVPFGFVVGDLTLPAGDYVIRSTVWQNAIVFQELGGLATAVTLATTAQRSQIPEVITQWTPGSTSGTITNPAPNKPIKSGENCVIFSKYGDQYFVSKIWVGLEGREFPVSRSESQLKTASIFIERGIVVLDAAVR